MESLNKCPICDHESHKEFLLVNDYSITKEDFHIVQCDGCDFKFTNPRPAQNEIGKYYESDEYVSHSDTNEGIVNKIYQMVKVCTLSKKLALLNRLRPKGNVLDIGAGTGAFLKFCGDNGWEITGVEPDESARKIAPFLFLLPLWTPILTFMSGPKKSRFRSEFGTAYFFFGGRGQGGYGHGCFITFF